jgi:penicillin-binding protein 1A
VTSEATAYQMVSMLQGVVERGTRRIVKEVGRPLAGKTGTTNDSNDAWFLGFSPDLAVGVYLGFDQPKSLGDREQGATVAAPVFRDFMAEALKDQPVVPFRIPPASGWCGSRPRAASWRGQATAMSFSKPSSLIPSRPETAMLSMASEAATVAAMAGISVPATGTKVPRPLARAASISRFLLGRLVPAGDPDYNPARTQVGKRNGDAR